MDYTAIKTATKTQVDSAVKALVASLATLTKQEESTLLPFAKEFGTAAAKWGVELAWAKAKGDAAVVAQKVEDFKLLTDAATLEAGDYGIEAQAISEDQLVATLTTVAHAAIMFV